MVHVCPRCNYISRNKSDVKRHFGKATECKVINKDIPIDDCLVMLEEGKFKLKNFKKHECVCGKVYDRKTRLDSHKHKCDVQINSKISDNELEILNKQIELEKLRHQNEKEIIKLIKPVPFHKETKQNFIYLLQEREFIKTGECVYKIGKTINPKARLTDYSKGTMVCCLLLCENCDELEKRLIAIFTEKFKLRCDIGKEYFEGDVYEMVKTIKLN
jgi:hypothetical protein